MKDLMRFQFRQVLRERIFYFTFFTVTLTFFLIMLLDSGDVGEVPTTATEYLTQMLNLFSSFALMVGAVVIGIICCSDFTDKTINHELSAGRSRAAVFFSRAIPAIMATLIMVLATCILPFLAYGAINGWGDTVPVSVLVQRFVLAAFPLLRLSCLLVLIAFVVKHIGGPLMAGFAMIFLTFGLDAGLFSLPIFDLMDDYPCLFGFSNLNDLFSFDNWYVNTLVHLNIYYIYDFPLSGSYIAATVIISLVMSAVYLLLGYHFFHLDDMN